MPKWREEAAHTGSIGRDAGDCAVCFTVSQREILQPRRGTGGTSNLRENRQSKNVPCAKRGTNSWDTTFFQRRDHDYCQSLRQFCGYNTVGNDVMFKHHEEPMVLEVLMPFKYKVFRRYRLIVS